MGWFADNLKLALLLYINRKLNYNNQKDVDENFDYREFDDWIKDKAVKDEFEEKVQTIKNSRFINITYEDVLCSYLITIDYRKINDVEESFKCNIEEVNLKTLSLLEIYMGRGEVFISRGDRDNKAKTLKCPKCNLSSTSDYWDIKAMKRLGISDRDFISISKSLRLHIRNNTNFICPVCNKKSTGLEILINVSKYEDYEWSDDV